MSQISHNFAAGKPNSKGQTSITYTFMIKGQRFAYGTGQMIDPELWDKNTMRPTTEKQLIKSHQKIRPQIATELENISSRLSNIIAETERYLSIKERGREPVDFAELKEYLDKIFKPSKKKKQLEETTEPLPEPPRAPYIKDLIHEYLRGMYDGKKRPKTKARQNYDHGTIKAYLTFKNMFDELEDHFGRRYLVTDISADFENDLHEFFNEVKEYTPNTKGKMIKMMKTIMHDFLEMEAQAIYESSKNGQETVLSIIDLNHIEKQLNRIIKPTSKPVHIALDESELQTLYDLDLNASPHLDRARDIFLTGCYTGLRHSDYSRIGPEHIQNDFIQIIMFKTKDKVIIPIVPQLLEILKKWKYKIPDLTSQELNRYIKEVGYYAGITQLVEITEDKGNQTIINRKPKNELITTHTARRSFATNSFYSGMNSLDIMKITGHKKLETFQKYIIHDPTREMERQRKNRAYHLQKVV